jgi:hypothetical protein
LDGPNCLTMEAGTHYLRMSLTVSGTPSFDPAR